MTVQNRAALKSDKDTAFADNSAGDISAADLRGEFEDVIDSVYIAGDDNSGDTQLMTAAEKSKLSGIESSATADQTGAEIKAAYEGEANTNAFTDADHTKLDGIATGATANTGALADLDTVDTAQVDNDAITIAKLAATGTASSSTFLRGDNTWAAPAGGGGGDLLAANNLSDVDNAGTSRTNLGVAIGSDVQAFSSVLAATTASYTTAEETKLSGVATGATANSGALADLNTVDTAQIDDDAVTIAKLSATGTASASTYLRGDNTWAAVSGSGDAWGDAVDANIVPDADGTRDIGSTGTRFNHVYTDNLTVTDGISVAAYTGVLGLNAGTSVDVNTRALLEARLSDVTALVETTDTQTLTNKTLTAPVVTTPEVTYTEDDDGTQSSGTYTPSATGGNIKEIVNGGAFTLGVPSSAGTYIVQVTNNGSAGAITTSSYSIVTGDTLTTTNGDDFLLYVAVVGAFSHLNVVALQ